jgi:1-acyl-sn-glycerol-3-phosphate acyltransferase
MKVLRSIAWTIPLFALSTIFFGSLSILVALFETTGVRQMKLAKIWGRSLVWIAGVKLLIEGVDKVSHGGTYIFTPNHLSYMDTPALLASIPADFRFLAKEELFKIPFLGNHLKMAGHVSVPLEDPRASLRTLTNAAKLIREHQKSLLIFPEGGRSVDGVLQQFMPGAAYLAIKSGIPIVPVALIGTRDVLPMHGKIFTPRPVTVRFGEPIVTEGLSVHDRDRVTAEMREQVVNMLAGHPAKASARTV